MRAKSLEARGKPEKKFEILTPEEEAARKKPVPTTLESKPTLQTARLARIMAARSLGKEGLARYFLVFVLLSLTDNPCVF